MGAQEVSATLLVLTGIGIVLSDVLPAMQVSQEEVIGPVLARCLMTRSSRHWN